MRKILAPWPILSVALGHVSGPRQACGHDIFIFRLSCAKARPIYARLPLQPLTGRAAAGIFAAQGE